MTLPAILSFPLIINSILRSEFIVYCPAALGHWRRMRMMVSNEWLGDLTIVSHPQRRASAPDTWLHESVPLEFHCTVKPHRCAVGECLKVEVGKLEVCLLITFTISCSVCAALTCFFFTPFLCFGKLLFFQHLLLCSHWTGWVISFVIWRENLRWEAGRCFGSGSPIFWSVMASYGQAWLILLPPHDLNVSSHCCFCKLDKKFLALETKRKTLSLLSILFFWSSSC